jgi:hypothetical protein
MYNWFVELISEFSWKRVRILPNCFLTLVGGIIGKH